MQRSIIIFGMLLIAGAVTGFAQGGKAEPKRIEFKVGSSAATVTGTLNNGEEMEYVFAAQKGQTVTIRNSNTSLFDFRVFSKEFEFETEFESSRTLTFEIPATGDYNFFIRKKLVKRPRTARFTLSISIT